MLKKVQLHFNIAWRKCTKSIWKLNVLTRSIHVRHLIPNDLYPRYYLFSWISITLVLIAKTVFCVMLQDSKLLEMELKIC